MFKTERDLVIEITKNLENPKCISSLFKNPSKSRIFEEVDLGYGIPDVVVVQYNDKKNRRKEFLSFFDISILELIEKRSDTSIDDIIYLTRSTENKINNSLSILQNENLIMYREGKYFSHEKYVDALEDSIAIEAKLKNWKRALQQAYRYKWFSSKSYVVLPIDNIKPALNNLELFKKYGVGLASINSDNELEVHHKAEDTPPYSEKMYKLLNEYLLNDLSSE